MIADTNNSPHEEDLKEGEVEKPEGEDLKAEPAAKPDPTRLGDWEKNGRCIDF